MSKYKVFEMHEHWYEHQIWLVPIWLVVLVVVFALLWGTALYGIFSSSENQDQCKCYEEGEPCEWV